MGRRSIPSTTLAAQVRAHYGLTQAELGAFLGVSQGQVAHVEAGRHLFSPAVNGRLLQLAGPVFGEEPATAATAATAVPLPSPAPGPLEARLDYCRHKAAQLRRALRPLQQTVRLAGRWAAALPRVLATLPATPDAKATRRRAWLAAHTAALTPDDVARYHLLRLQAEALETEAAALAALLT